jgi:hypothetical protein
MALLILCWRIFPSSAVTSMLTFLQIKLPLLLEYLLAGHLCIIKTVLAQELNLEVHHVSFLLGPKYIFPILGSYYHYGLTEQLGIGMIQIMSLLCL